MFYSTTWKQKLGLMALGSIFTIIGMLFVIGILPSVTAQRDKFGDIECTSLRVVDVDGRARVMLITNERGGLVGASGKDGNSMVGLTIAEGGGMVEVHGKDGKLAASVSVTERGGMVVARGKDGESAVGLSIDEELGGVVATVDRYGTPKALD